ncbi:hypothetical protein [Rhodococcus sp. NPDC058514]|uniref:hypothetical protein n=1 Tax=unclassified Rhodococcus (in: high G+C Gram-positive bacteria) TaxID=192944 RepID=UPI0036601861
MTFGVSNRNLAAFPLGVLAALPAGIVLGGIAIAAGTAALGVIRRGILRDRAAGQIVLFALTTAVAVTAVAALPFLIGGGAAVTVAVAPLAILFAVAVIGASTYAPLALRTDALRR